VWALKERKIAGAGLDVYEQEPGFESELAEMDNVVMVPHIGSASVSTRTKMAMMVASGAIDVLEGRMPAHLVNPEVWENRRT
jgi:glyoxylate reductase